MVREAVVQLMSGYRIEELHEDGRVVTRRRYVNDQLVAEMHYVASELPDGVAREWYETGELRRTRRFINGSVEGEDLVVWPDGSVRTRRTRFARQNHGVDERFYRDATPRMIGQWREGVREGTWRWNYPSGESRLEVPYRGGDINGVVRFWDAHGVVAFEAVVDRGRVGEVRIKQAAWDQAVTPRGAQASQPLIVHDEACRPIVAMDLHFGVPHRGLGFTASKALKRIVGRDSSA